MTKKDIEKVNRRLQHGDKKVIAEMSQLHPVTISRFFRGLNGDISEETALKIIRNAEKIIRERERLSKKSQKIINRL
jgi:hypothetical protein